MVVGKVAELVVGLVGQLRGFCWFSIRSCGCSQESKCGGAL